MGDYIATSCADHPLTIFARIDESNPHDLQLMGVLKEE
jgi:hypothetical protein